MNIHNILTSHLKHLLVRELIFEPHSVMSHLNLGRVFVFLLFSSASCFILVSKSPLVSDPLLAPVCFSPSWLSAPPWCVSPVSNYPYLPCVYIVCMLDLTSTLHSLLGFGCHTDWILVYQTVYECIWGYVRCVWYLSTCQLPALSDGSRPNLQS